MLSDRALDLWAGGVARCIVLVGARSLGTTLWPDVMNPKSQSHLPLPSRRRSDIPLLEGEILMLASQPRDGPTVGAFEQALSTCACLAAAIIPHAQ